VNAGSAASPEHFNQEAGLMERFAAGKGRSAPGVPVKGNIP